MSQQKTFLFAGASSAIAQKTAEVLQEKGHHVIGISTKENQATYKHFFQVDSYNFGSFPAIEQDIDGIVYFPGTINLKPFSRLSESEFRNDFEINSIGAVAFVQSYLKNLKSSDHASIVFISSVAVSTGLPVHSSISMAKGAIE